jgi:type VI secretion system secreted protein VgrG
MMVEAPADAPMKVMTPLGGDLLFHRMTVREGLSSVSELEIELLSDRNNIAYGDLLGKNITVGLELQSGDEPRYFNGYVTRFAQTGMRGRYHLYHVRAQPWFWFLTRTSTCRIFQQKKVEDIVKDVFQAHDTCDVTWALTGSYRTWDYCVQYRETDFNFVSRLLEQEGMYYYFKHLNGRHTMVITDSVSGHAAFPGYDQMTFIPQDRKRPDQEGITTWTFATEIHPGRFVHDDYNFEQPTREQLANGAKERSHAGAAYEIYDYPGGYETPAEGEAYARVRAEEAQAQFEVAQGSSNGRGLCTGYLFKLKNHFRDDQLREYLVIGATHELEYSDYESLDSPGSSYSCTFRAIDSREQFRAARRTPKPVVQGPQTAIVVGPQGEEIYTDKYGRVKVLFHWDRYGKADENSSCWIRVSHGWAGKKWGAVFLPRIGQEVIVDFLEGDPDRPIITGRVYNGDAMPPYALPAEATKSTIKSNSSKGGGGFNEIRFEDKKGAEQIFVHAERNHDNRVKNDSMEWIGQDRHLIVNRDQFEKVSGDKHLQIAGDQNEKVDGTVSLKIGADLQQKISAKHALDAGQEIHLKAGTNVIIEAGATLTLKVGGNFVVLNSGGVFIKGVMVNINSGGAATSGSGAQPDAAKDPVEADNAVAGEKDAPPPAAAPPTLKTLGKSPQVVALIQAAQSGAPFCARCEELRQSAVPAA